MELHAVVLPAQRDFRVLTVSTPIRELAGIDASRGGALPDSLLESTEPVVVRGLVSHWPMVQAARRSPAEASAYLLRLYSGMKVTVLNRADMEKGLAQLKTLAETQKAAPEKAAAAE